VVPTRASSWAKRLKRLASRYSRVNWDISWDIGKSRLVLINAAIKLCSCRLVPEEVRTLISIPAGLSGMPLVPFVLYSTFSTLLWVGLPQPTQGTYWGEL